MTQTIVESPEATAQRASCLSQVFNAVLTAMAILDVAKLPKFRAQLAADCPNSKEARSLDPSLDSLCRCWPVSWNNTPRHNVHAISRAQQVLPSFVRMPQEGRGLGRG